MSKALNQMEVVHGIASFLESKGIVGVESRHMNVIIRAADILCDEFGRESVQASDGMGLQAWLDSDDTGMSSRWMAHVCAGAPRKSCHELRAYPYDPSDFGRCYRFLRAVPEARGRLDRLRASGPVWAAYIDRWDEMERLYEEELPSGRAPKLYALMQSIQDDAKKEPRP